MKRSILLAIILTLAFSSVCFARVVKQYFPDGSVYSSMIFNDNGSAKGPLKIYWPNGRLKVKTIYKHGQPFVTHTWNINGVRTH